MSAFMRAKELAAIGEAAALQQVPKIRHLLTRLDPRLFPAGPSQADGAANGRLAATPSRIVAQ
jgi:hypothetical protein